MIVLLHVTSEKKKKKKVRCSLLCGETSNIQWHVHAELDEMSTIGCTNLRQFDANVPEEGAQTQRFGAKVVSALAK